VRVTWETVGTIDQRGYSGKLAQIGNQEKKRVSNILTIIGNGIQEIQEAGIAGGKKKGECRENVTFHE
jgi:hypothetical protein